MLKMTSSNFSATSTIDGKDVVYFNATVQSVGSTTISKTISDKTLYSENKTECDADYADFETQISAYMTEE